MRVGLNSHSHSRVVLNRYRKYLNGKKTARIELNRMKSLRDRSLKDDAKAYSSPDKLREVIHKAGIANFRIIYDRAGIWAELKK